MRVRKLLLLCTMVAAMMSTTICAPPLIANADDAEEEIVISNAQVGTIYKANQLFTTTSPSNHIGAPDMSNPVSFTDADEQGTGTIRKDRYAALGRPFGTISWSADTADTDTYPVYCQDPQSTSSLTYNIKEAGTYHFYLMAPIFTGRYADIYLDEEKVIDGQTYAIPGDHTIGQSGTYRKIGIIEVSATLEAGAHTYKLDPTGFESATYYMGTIAVVLVKDGTVTEDGVVTHDTFDNDTDSPYANAYYKKLSLDEMASEFNWLVTNKAPRTTTGTNSSGNMTVTVPATTSEASFKGNVVLGLILVLDDDSVTINNVELSYTVE